MKVPENITRCVAFLGFDMADGTFRLAGTVFFVVRDGHHVDSAYAVTAKHVIDEVAKLGIDSLIIRMNMKDGSLFRIKVSNDLWIFSDDPTVDIAILPFFMPIGSDHLFYPMSRAMTPTVVQQNEIDLGDEVFITGLFKHHHGDRKNIPIVRVGNIASLLDEKVQTKNFLMDAYLIEARSIGGLSGSPVFVNLGFTRYVQGQIKNSSGGHIHFLMGLIHGHFDVSVSAIDNVSIDSLNETSRVNTGIAIVTPIEKLIQMFQQKRVLDSESFLLSQQNQQV